MFAWMYRFLGDYMVERVFWLLVDDYWLSWWKDLISNFPLLSFSIFFLICLPVLVHQLQKNTVPPSSPPSFTPEPITVTNISPTNSNIDRNVTGDSNNMSTVFDPNPEIQAIEVDLPLVTQPKSSIVVIGSQFCSNNKIELTITGKTEKSIFDNFCVKDGNGKIIFKIKEGDSLFHTHRILVDDAGRSILSMKRKLKSVHHRWEAFKGDSTNDEDHLFSAKRTKIIQLFRTKLEVFLASNASEDICDFLVKTELFRQSLQISGSSGILLAQMKKALTPSVGNETYMVTVNPNIDYAFIVSLIFILHMISDVLKLPD